MNKIVFTPDAPARSSSYIFYIFIIALFLRILFFSFLRDYPLLYIQSLDEEYYLNFGKTIAGGSFFDGQRDFFMDPFYGYFLGGIFLIFGDNLTTIRLVQILIDALNVLIIYEIGYRVWNRQAGILAALIWAFYSVSFYYSLLILKVSIAVNAMLLFILLLLHTAKSHRWIVWFLAGVAAGVLNYIRANFILLVPVTLVFYFFIEQPDWRRFSKTGMAFIAGALCLLSLNAVRTYLINGSASMLITSSGRIMYSSNNPENISGLYDVPSFSRSHPVETEKDFHREAERRTGRSLSPKEVSQYWQAETFHVLRNNPQIIPVLILNKLKWIVANYEIPMNQSYRQAADFSGFAKWPFPNYAFVLAMGFPGLIIGMIRQRRVGWCLVPVLTILATLIIFYVASRLKMPMVPFLIIGSGIGFSVLHQWLTQKQFKKIFCLSGIALLLFFSSVWIPPPPGDGHKEYGLAKAFYLQNNLDKSEMLALSAVKQYPDNTDLYILLGRISRQNGRIDQSMEYYQEALRISDENFTANHDLAMLYIVSGKPEKAVFYLEKCLKQKQHIQSMLALAGAYEAGGNKQKAVMYYEKYLKSSSSDDPGRKQAIQRLNALR